MEYIDSLPVDEMHEIHSAVAVINIDEQMQRIRAASFPNIKENGRRDYERSLQSARRRLIKNTGPALSIADLAKEQALRMGKSGDRKTNS